MCQPRVEAGREETSTKKGQDQEEEEEEDQAPVRAVLRVAHQIEVPTLPVRAAMSGLGVRGGSENRRTRRGEEATPEVASA